MIVPAVNSTGNPGRIEWVDSLRGLAAVLVVVHHTGVMEALHLWGRSFQGYYLNLGVIGVGVFFLISGYIIPCSVSKLKDRPSLRFMLARFFRLYPAYWVSLLAATVVFAPAAKDVLINVSMLQRFVGAKDVIGAYWTLQAELMFYGTILVLLWTKKLSKPKVAVICTMAFALIAVSMAAGRYFLGIKTPLAAALGLLLMYTGYCFHFVKIQLLSVSAFIKILLLAYSAIVLASLLGYQRDWGYGEVPSRFILSYLFAIAAFFGAARFVCSPPGAFVYLGSISYSLYLFHQVVQHGLESCHFTLPPAVFPILSISVSLIVAALVYRMVEKPGIALGRYINKTL